MKNYDHSKTRCYIDYYNDDIISVLWENSDLGFGHVKFDKNTLEIVDSENMSEEFCEMVKIRAGVSFFKNHIWG